MIDRTATARVQRLIRWLEPFQGCFGHRAQGLALRTYVHGLFSDSDRKSMQAMLARVTDPITYQGFQHFMTHAVWDADRIWRRLLAVLPERHGVLIIDGTSFPKQGTHSVGVARQYCGALGKIANCQVAVTAALWTGAWRSFAPAWAFPGVFLLIFLITDTLGHPLLGWWLLAMPLFFWSFFRATRPWLDRRIRYWHQVFLVCGCSAQNPREGWPNSQMEPTK